VSIQALDKGKFIKWLLSKEPTEIVAEDWNSRNCPICKFLQHAWNEQCGIVGLTINPEMEGGGLFRVDSFAQMLHAQPTWVREFIYWADLVKPRSLTAEECLEILFGHGFDETKWHGNERPLIIGPMVSI